MRTFWYTLALFLVVIGGINFWVDLAHRWHRLPHLFNKNWAETEVLVTPDDFDEQHFRSAHLEVIPTPEIVVMGSSTMLNVDGSFLLPGVAFYNASMAGSSTEDYILIWQRLKELRKIPKRVILAFDPAVFGEEHSLVHTGETIETTLTYLRFLRGHLNEPAGVTAWISTASQIFACYRDNISELVNWEVTQKSLAMLLKSSPRELAALEAHYGVTPQGVRPSEMTAWKANGAIVRPVTQLRIRSRDEIQTLAQNGAWGDDWHTKIMISLPHTIPQNLRWLLSEMRAEGVQVMLLRPPIQSDALAVFLQREDTAKAFSDAKRFSADLAQDYQAPLCDRVDGSKYCGPTDFHDTVHMVSACAQRIVHSCLIENPDWAPLANR